MCIRDRFRDSGAIKNSQLLSAHTGTSTRVSVCAVAPRSSYVHVHAWRAVASHPRALFILAPSPREACVLFCCCPAVCVQHLQAFFAETQKTRIGVSLGFAVVFPLEIIWWSALRSAGARASKGTVPGAMSDDEMEDYGLEYSDDCLLYTSPSPRDGLLSRMPSSA